MQRFTILIFFLLALVFFALNTGCEKEYSYEAGIVPDSILIHDSIVAMDTAHTKALLFPACEGCKNTDTVSSLNWSFKAGNTILCGGITNTIVSPEGLGLTFFGPSACSPDSGLVITAAFSVDELHQNPNNLKATKASLEYYDNTTHVDVLQSRQPNIFTLIIDHYNQQTGIATGRFGGTVVAKNGALVRVDAGRFRIKF